MEGVMEPICWTIPNILDATGGERICGPSENVFVRVSIDSRRISKNDLFVAICGKQHDGHDFIEAVVAAGVSGIIAAEDRRSGLPVHALRENVCCILVADTVRALGDMAGFQRRRAGVAVAAITGSNGKTTTKEMAAAVMGEKFNTLSTPGNLNNEIGLPLTLLNLGRSHEAAVVELGMNHPGEIRRLGEICSPDIGVITNIGPAHLEGLGSVEAVMRAKGELIERIKTDGWLVLNGDDPYCVRLGKEASRKVLYFGLSPHADIRAEGVTARGVGTAFVLELPNERVPIEVKAPGRFMVTNALAASAIGHLLGLSADAIKSGLEAFKPANGRMHLFETAFGVFVIDDTYNANPTSMEAAIQTLVSLRGKGSCVLVAGDMLELGEQAERFHETLGGIAVEAGVTRLYATGGFANAVARGALKAGMAAAAIITGAKPEITAHLLEFVVPGDWVLVKGSRGMGMEDIVQALTGAKPAAEKTA
jgi:UDP-N-acetylmuramoyl-tripeptide--D-alanyl-D-alanine ligase